MDEVSVILLISDLLTNIKTREGLREVLRAVEIRGLLLGRRETQTVTLDIDTCRVRINYVEDEQHEIVVTAAWWLGEDGITVPVKPTVFDAIRLADRVRAELDARLEEQS